MLEHYLTYLSNNFGHLAAISLSVVLAVLAWLKLYFSNDSLILRLMAVPLPLLPILGALAVFWIFNMPPRQPRHLRQNRWNHYGRTEFGHDDGEIKVTGPLTRAERRKEARSKVKSGKRQGFSIMAIIVLGFLAINIVMYGLIAMRDGSGSYTNWWGGQVYGPAAVIIALLLLIRIVKNR